ncbi:U-scoloptoxin(11)-Sm5a-like [Brevipalpus obovatus]|uniref:U-scoloptoxin(11)-Sm5a-like n=1 Tax=Brevipalpus obovatus TaxID=246614 RepID=UPI003D9F09D8
MQACIYASAISIAFILLSARFAFCRSTDIRMGEIEKLCLDGSACGLVQLNMRGINREELCKCRHSHCPLEWDPLDGRTVMHGFDQYKYCHRAPILKPCSPGQLVYTWTMISHSSAPKVPLHSNQLHCLCPSNHIFQVNGTSQSELPEGYVMDTISYRCELPKYCESGGYCMVISETEKSTFAKRLCSCPRDSFCPMDIRRAQNTMVIESGSIYQMKCI